LGLDQLERHDLQWVMRGCRLHDAEQLARHRARPRRLGLEPRSFFYGTAGAAFANVQAAAGAFPFMSSTEPAWTAGVGLEYAFAPNWTAKAEYLFVDLANASCGFANCGGTNTTVSLNENILRAGINFKFGGGWW
jgi:outer membrane immunogenic protein